MELSLSSKKTTSKWLEVIPTPLESAYVRSLRAQLQKIGRKTELAQDGIQRRSSSADHRAGAVSRKTQRFNCTPQHSGEVFLYFLRLLAARQLEYLSRYRSCRTARQFENFVQTHSSPPTLRAMRFSTPMPRFEHADSTAAVCYAVSPC